MLTPDLTPGQLIEGAAHNILADSMVTDMAVSYMYAVAWGEPPDDINIVINLDAEGAAAIWTANAEKPNVTVIMANRPPEFPGSIKTETLIGGG